MTTISNDISKSDLHVHSKYSNRPKTMVLKGVVLEKVFSEPVDIYKCCRDAGMDFVTITDHNTIKGSLDIMHLPNTFISRTFSISIFPKINVKFIVLFPE